MRDGKLSVARQARSARFRRVDSPGAAQACFGRLIFARFGVLCRFTLIFDFLTLWTGALCFASATTPQPQAKAMASASVRNLISLILLRGAGKPQVPP